MCSISSVRDTTSPARCLSTDSTLTSGLVSGSAWPSIVTLACRVSSMSGPQRHCALEGDVRRRNSARTRASSASMWKGWVR
ncbi:hypothetical protein G6F60_015314 [Rhizopus arrhizus]|nr:hypothetical protein G6F60_015314 [Rhizopus arrhizus]